MSSTMDVEQAEPVVHVEEQQYVEQAEPVVEQWKPRLRKTPLIAIAVLTLVLVGLAVGLAVGLSRRESPPPTTTEQEDGGTTEPQEEDILDHPSSDVKEICNSLNVGETTCEDACRQASCCHPFGSKSCWENNQETCQEWIDAGCFLFGVNAEPPLDEPTEEVKDICSNSNVEDCQDVCMPASCCEFKTGENSCWEDNEETCQAWLDAGCFNPDVNAVVAPLDEPTSEVKEICGSLNVGEITCEDACRPARCCQMTTGEDSCYQDNQESCEKWLDAGCFLLAVNSAAPLDPPSVDLEQVCRFSFASDDLEMEECVDSCIAASCCFESYAGGCSSNPVCSEYAPCKPVLNRSNEGSLAFPPEEMWQICQEDSVMCQEMCEAAACCESIGEDSCLEGNLDTCVEWAEVGCSLVATTDSDEPVVALTSANGK